ncbi:MAG TPA: hypothetical protein VGT40_23205 [Methylomirabilota bacterium]|jgi:hypothetical protein|nr:hypothetical protein [Methylomirabilota bacterium]
MREFAKGQFTLRQAPRALRLIYAGFLFLTALGLLSQLGFQVGRIGLSPQAIARYYRGDDTGAVMAFPKTFGQLLEVTHAHTFMMAVVFLVLAHLFAATDVADIVKSIVLAASFTGLLGDLAAPWLIRYVAARCAWIALVSWMFQWAGLAALIGMSGWECLGRRHPR